MTIDEILRLKEAGFTADEIVAMGPVATAAQPEAPEVSQEVPAAPDMKPILDKLTALEQRMQSANIMGIPAPGPATTNAGDVLANILDPRIKE